MLISYGRIFKKMFQKQPKNIQKKFEERLLFFVRDSRNPLLNIHALEGEWAGCKSFNVTGDIRAVYEEVDKNKIELVAIGSHSELYS